MGLRGLIGEADPFLKPLTCPEGILFEALLRLYPYVVRTGHPMWCSPCCERTVTKPSQSQGELLFA